MSLKIIKSGLLDTIQDMGRYGYQHLGINPGGAMDRFSAQLANALLGKDLTDAVIEMHFPAAQILFEKETIICITGADLSPTINKKKIPLNQPIAVSKKSELHFEKKISGACCYLSILHEPDIYKWLNSYSTNLVAAAGGFKGRALKKGDIINFKNDIEYNLPGKELPLQWKASGMVSLKKQIRFIKGNEWDWLTEISKWSMTQDKFTVTTNSNRMGYRLQGSPLQTRENKQLVSSAVTFGTIQLLPDGQLIILMADHQTTGGYPRAGHIISADLPSLAQCNAGDEISFTEVEVGIAEQEYIKQQQDLLHMQTAAKFKIENLLHAMRY